MCLSILPQGKIKRRQKSNRRKKTHESRFRRIGKHCKISKHLIRKYSYRSFNPVLQNRFLFRAQFCRGGVGVQSFGFGDEGGGGGEQRSPRFAGL